MWQIMMLWYLVIGVFDLDGPVKEGLPEKVSWDLKAVVTDKISKKRE